MLLAIDIGNSTTSVGLFGLDRELKFLATLDTDSRRTADQFSIDLMNVFALYHYDLKDVSGAIVCSVVPPLNFMLEKAVGRLLGKPPMVVGPGVKTGLNIRMDFQTQMGADIVADAVAALEKFTAPIVTIDMGTATTIGVISHDRTYEGGLLLPGVNVSLEALSRRAAQLPAISVTGADPQARGLRPLGPTPPPASTGPGTVTTCSRCSSPASTNRPMDGRATHRHEYHP